MIRTTIAAICSVALLSTSPAKEVPSQSPDLQLRNQQVVDVILGRTSTPGSEDSNYDGQIDSADFVNNALPDAVYRINAGGTAHVTDGAGRVWSPDDSFANTGVPSATTTEIINAPAGMGPIYQTDRIDFPEAPDLAYTFFLEPGVYAVNLHFAEIYDGAVGVGDRTFGVQLENETLFSDFDVRAQAPQFNAVRRGRAVTVLDGQLDVGLQHGNNLPKISGIEVLPLVNSDLGRDVIARINVGGPPLTDVFGRNWSSDEGLYNTGNPGSTAEAVSGTAFPQIYQTVRYDPDPAEPNMVFTVPDVPPGNYTVRMHFADFDYGQPGARVFNVYTEGQLTFPGIDIGGEGGRLASVVKESDIDVFDGALQIAFERGVEPPKVSGIEVLLNESYARGPSPSVLDWGVRQAGEASGMLLSMRNPEPEGFVMNRFSMEPTFGSASDFTAHIGGTAYHGAPFAQTWTIDQFVAPNDSYLMQFDFNPATFGSNDVKLTFETTVGTYTAWLFGSTGEATGHEFLRPFATFDEASLVDWDQDGIARVFGDASGSYTRRPGTEIVSHEWFDGPSLYSTTAVTQNDFPVGQRDVTLKISDNTGASTTGDFSFEVTGPEKVSSALAMYYVAGNGGPIALLDDPPTAANFIELTQELRVGTTDGKVGNSPIEPPVMVRFLAIANVPASGVYEFDVDGGGSNKLLINGNAVTEPLFLETGLMNIDLRVAIDHAGRLPVSLAWGPEAGPYSTIAGELLHDETVIAPTINFMTEGGPGSGGNPIEIKGVGFFPPNDISVNWGNNTLTSDQITVGPRVITFNAPNGRGVIDVTVSSPRGRSNIVQYTYETDQSVPISFSTEDIASISNPTTGEVGPDGKLYVGTQGGVVSILTLDDNNNVSNTQNSFAISGLSNHEILGLGFNPWDEGTNTHVYVAHSQLYANGGTCFSGFSPYSGQVSRLDGPNFDVINPIVQNLPVSNHDHGINGIQFTNNGDMLVNVGGVTNAGVFACPIGGLNASPLSGAIIIAETSKPDFNGNIIYLDGGGNPNNNQVSGASVHVADGVDVRVFSSGHRNPYDLVYMTDSRIYATDNGPNAGFGAASYGPGSQGGEPTAPDELNFVEEGNYYGHPNRTRGQSDFRQNIYHDVYVGSGNGFTQALTTFPSSTNGLFEYRADTFNGAMRGELIVQKFHGETYRVGLSPDGRSVSYKQWLPWYADALDVCQAPGGAIIGIDWDGNKVRVSRPNDSAAQGLTVYDIFPWRSPTDGGRPFVIGGANFGDTSNTKVTFGGVQAQLTSVSSTRIKGIIPSVPAAPSGLIDIGVTVGSTTVFHEAAFKYLGDEVNDNGARASIEIDPGSDINMSSTYSTGSFKVTNTSQQGQLLTKATIDFRTAMFMDCVYDPFATAGDSAGKPFTLDFNGTGGGVTTNYLSSHDGGFDALEINFSNCNPGQQIQFSIDVDPTTVNGTTPPGPNHSGSISGLELIGSTVTFEFNDGTVLVGEPWRNGNSVTGCFNVVKVVQPERPGIEVLGLDTIESDTSQQGHTLRVTGPVGSQVSLIQVEAGLWVDGGGFDVDPFEANTALNVEEFSAQIGTEQFVDFNVNLKKSDFVAGYNYFAAVIKDSEGHNGKISSVVRLKYNP